MYVLCFLKGGPSVFVFIIKVTIMVGNHTHILNSEEAELWEARPPRSGVCSVTQAGPTGREFVQSSGASVDADTKPAPRQPPLLRGRWFCPWCDKASGSCSSPGLRGRLNERIAKEGSGVVNRTVEQKHLREYWLLLGNYSFLGLSLQPDIPQAGHSTSERAHPVPASLRNQHDGLQETGPLLGPPAGAQRCDRLLVSCWLSEFRESGGAEEFISPS